MSGECELIVAGNKAVRQQKLAEYAFFNAPEARIAYIAMDVQKDCWKHVNIFRALWSGTSATRTTDEIAKKIGEITPTLRQLCDETFIVFMDPKKQGIDKAFGGLYQVRPQHGDILVAKTKDNVFDDNILVGTTKNNNLKESQMEAELEERQVTHIVYTGFRADCCVKKSVLTSLEKNFNVAVTADAVGLGDNLKPAIHLQEMLNAGALITTSNEVVTCLKNRQPQRAYG